MVILKTAEHGYLHMMYYMPLLEYLGLLFVGFCAGLLGSFLGVGGGVVVLPSLVFIFGFRLNVAVGCTVVVVFLNGVISGLMHLFLRNFRLDVFRRVVWVGVLGSVVGSLLFFAFSRFVWFLSLCLGSYFIYVASRSVYEVVKRPVASSSRSRGGIVVYLCGFAAGLVVGLLGMGSGAVLVPLFMYVLDLPAKIAVGTSLLCFAPMALVSVIFKLAQHSVDLLAVACVAPGLVVGARLGSRLLLRAPLRVFKLVFGIVFLMIGIKFLMNGVAHLAL
ncbi:MAG: sulfite exporter TauE/SafE family protein [Crenarchaeota archaeon]|nr:sulfite exporter TauE/SafE family protein [Thermoproteota archaeon]